MVDFEMMNPLIVKLNEVDPKEILYSIPGFTNSNINSPQELLVWKNHQGHFWTIKKNSTRS